MARFQRTSYNTVDVFAAACAANRVNGGYLKYTETNDESGTSKLANKVLIRQFLDGTFDVRDSDREHGEKVMRHCRSLTFKLLANKRLSDFEQNMLSIVEKETLDSNYDIAIVSSLPNSYDRNEYRRAIDTRVRETEGVFGTVGERVQITAEVVKCYFSYQWDTHFVTVITDDNKQVFFAYKQSLTVGDHINIEGKVKAHRDNATQLNYVKLMID
jgi:hypothetical protein